MMGNDGPLEKAIDAAACPGGPAVLFDFAATAGLYATVTTVLAGFAFTAVVLILERPTRTTVDPLGKRAHELSLLPIGILSLVLATIFYAEMAGDQSCTSRQLTSLLAGVLFAHGAVLLFVSLAWLLHNRHEPGVGRNAVVISWSVLGIATLMLWGGIDTTRRELSQTPIGNLPTLDSWLHLAILVLGGTVLVVAASSRDVRDDSLSAYKWPVRALLAVPLVVTLLYMCVEFFTPNEFSGQLFAGVRTVLWLLTIAAVAFIIPPVRTLKAR
jgi:hypothetical protein